MRDQERGKHPGLNSCFRAFSAAVCMRSVNFPVLGSRVSRISAIAALACFVVAAGTVAAYASPAHFGTAVFQASPGDEAPARAYSQTSYAGALDVVVTFTAFSVITLLSLPEFTNRSHGVISATSIRPPPVA